MGLLLCAHGLTAVIYTLILRSIERRVDAGIERG
jgi:hypothetical protein